MATLTDLTTRHPALHHAAPSNTAPTQDTRSDWPVPVGGLSPHERAHFGM